MDCKRIDKKSISAEGVSVDLPLGKRVTKKFIAEFYKNQCEKIPEGFKPTFTVSVHCEYRFKRKTWTCGVDGRLATYKIYTVNDGNVSLDRAGSYVMY